MKTSLVVIVICLVALPAWATPPEPAQAAAAKAPANPALDFNLFDDSGTAPATAADDADLIAAKALKRRSLLRTHQILGTITWALMAATAVVGQLNYNDTYGSGRGSGRWLMPHRILSYTTAAAFASTATFALIAPQPYRKPLSLDTALVHRIAVIGAAAGMVTQVILGFITARQAQAGNERNLKTMAQTHLAVGYTTLGFMTVAGTVWMF